MGMLRTEGTIMTADNSNPIATKIDAAPVRFTFAL
jgi:hypothetical protein